MRRPIFLFPLLAVLFAGAPVVDARAQPAPSGTASAAAVPDDADRLFREGNELYKQKRFADAEALFEKAFAKKPAHDIAANLGYAEMYQNKLVEAAEHLAYAVRIWPPTGKDDKRQGAVERLAKVKEGIATLTIDVNVPGARVMIGDREVGTSPLAGEVFAEAGHVIVRVKREGYRDAERALDVAKGSAQTVSVALEAVPASVPTATVSATATASATAPAAPSARSPIPVFVLGGMAIVALGAGAGLDIAAASDDSAAKKTSQDIRAAGKSCVEGAANFDARCGALEDQARRGQTMSGVGVGLMIGAGVLAAGTVIYWLLPGAPPVRFGAAVVPDARRTSAAVSVTGEF